MEVLIVDGANVVGSRPDGWWRDRAQAARRLWDQLASADLPHDDVVLVLEGKAKKAMDPGAGHGPVRVIHAAGSGDDAIAEEVQARVGDDWDVLVVTADRGLRARVEAAGGVVKRPSWLLKEL